MQEVKNTEYPRVDAKKVEELINRSSVFMEPSSGMRPVQVRGKIRKILSQNAVYEWNNNGVMTENHIEGGCKNGKRFEVFH